MKHRLHLILCLALMCLPGIYTPLFGQFDFTYAGPNTFYLDANCEDNLDFGGFPPFVVSNIGAVIIPPTGVDEDLTGYAVNDLISSPQNVTVGFVAYDDQSNIDTFFFSISFVDSIAPVFNQPPPDDITVDCYGDIPNAPIIPAEDNCDGTIFVPGIDNPPMGGPNCVAPLVITRTWMANDASGNSTSITQLITVGVDTEAPTIGMLPSDGQGDCSVANAAYSTWLITQQNIILATAQDNCNVLSLTHDGPASVSGDCGIITVNFTLEDGCGFQAFASADFETIDSEAPTLVGAPSDITIACGEAIPSPPVVSAFDNCDLSLPAVTFTETDDQTANGSCNDANYTITRTWSVTDICGNLGEEIQIISIVDTIAPLFIVPQDTTLDCGSNIDPSVTGAIDIGSITDNCLSDFIITYSDDSTTVDCAQNIDVARTWMVADSCGNIREIIQLISLIDTIAPSFTAPAVDSLFLNCEDSTDPIATGEPTNIVDNCDGGAGYTYVDLFTDQVCTNGLTIIRTFYIEDVCGNIDSTKQYLIIQDIVPPVIDLEASDETITCTSNADAETAFDDWIAAMGNALASDNCATTLTWDAYNTGTAVSATLPPSDCMPAEIGIYRQQTVDFVVRDECMNSDTTTATFTVRDDVAPQVSNCPVDVTISTDPGICEGTISLSPPLIIEDCANEQLNLNFAQTLPVLPPPGTTDTLETPIQNLEFMVGVASSPVQASGDVTLTIRLDNVDGESADEYLEVYGEDGTFLGNTNLTPNQCDTSTTVFTIDAATYNSWAFDGVVEITAIPNDPSPLPGRFTVNAICMGGFVTAELDYPAVSPDGTKMEYTIDNGPRMEVNPIGPFDVTLPLGTFEITYYITDCAGNESSCSFNVTVTDQEPPVIECPDDFTVSTDPDQCSAIVDIPIPLSVMDNCGVTTLISQTAPTNPNEQLITFTTNPNVGVYNADDKTFAFFGLPATAVGDVTLTITLQGDIDEEGEFFTIFDPNSTTLGTTEIGQPHVTPGDCDTPSTATFTIPATTFNTWALTGFVIFIADSNLDFPVPPPIPEPGINPCDPDAVTSDGQNDGTSTISATVSYGTVIPSYFAEGATSIPPTPFTNGVVPPTHELNEGVTTVSYYVADFYGNLDTCSFEITVADNQAPVAECLSTIIFINPSGIVTDTIFPADINLGSTDNCGIDSMYVFPDLVTCDMIGDTLHVDLFVVDDSGNIGECESLIRIEGEAPEPTYFIADCGSDTLFLFANPPAGTDPNLYLYTWTGPQTFSSSDQNPIIPNVTSVNQGTYTVTIEGLTGCTSEGEVQVPIDDLPITPVISFDDDSVCDDQAIVLETAPPPGNNIVYQWYNGSFPTGNLVGTSLVSSFSIAPPHVPGDSCYYVIIVRDGCESNPSASECVTITGTPTAETNDDVIDVCEGGTIVLGSPSFGQGYEYYWTGPNYEAFTQNPPPILDVSVLNDGLYSLEITLNGCVSEFAFTVVNILDRPDQPVVGNTTSANAPACVGDTIILSTSLEGVTTYRWFGPGILEFETDTSILVLENATQAYAGEWTLEVVDNLCVSDLSEPTTVYVANLPMVLTSSNSPVCDNESLILNVNETVDATYSWEAPSGQVFNVQSPEIFPPEPGVYTITVTSLEFCVNTATETVVVNLAPAVTSVSNNAPDCPEGPTDICLFATVFPEDDGSYSYTWVDVDETPVSTDSIGKLFGAVSVTANGEYSLILTDGNGCSVQSAPTIVDMGPILADPNPPNPNGSETICEGDVLTLTTVDEFQGVMEIYHWITPVGDTTTTGPSVQFPPVTQDYSGSYSVYVEVDGCLTDTSGLTIIQVNQLPTGTVTSNSPVCEGFPIILEFQNCIPGADYEWFGPPPFSSANCSPEIPSATLGNTGTYTLVVELDGCSSEEFSTFVIVNESPQTPSVISSGDVCIDVPGAALTLSVLPGTATPGATYVWYVNGMPINDPTGLLTYTITDFSSYSEGEYLFTVIAELNGCFSEVSLATVVNMYETPNQSAFAGPDINWCEDEQVLLNATAPSQGTGLWAQHPDNPGGVSIINPTMASTEVMGTVPGNTYQFIWSLSNGACADYSIDTVSIFIDVIENAIAGPDIDVCAVNSVILSAELPITGSAMWAQPDPQAVFVTIENPTDPNSLVTGLVPGNTYLFWWTLADNGCGESVDELVVVVADAEAIAGIDYFDCGDGCTQLNAAEPVTAIGKWSSSDPDISFDDILDPKTTACNMKPGINVLVWTLNDGACGIDGTDSLFIDYKFAPVAQDDEVTVGFADVADFDVSLNDFIPADFFIEAISQPQHGVLISLGDGMFQYQAQINYIGTDEVIYQICSDQCECSEAVITFDIGGDAECVIPTIITPNGDGVNDRFVVPCFAQPEKFPDSDVAIFNQWGDEVFRASPYQNDWSGMYNGEDLPAGTYYYVVVFGDGTDPATGFLVIHR